MAAAGKKRTSEDPYIRCEMHCHHDLGAGMRVADLLDTDGPHGTRWPEPALAAPRPPATRRVPLAFAARA